MVFDDPQFARFHDALVLFRIDGDAPGAQLIGERAILTEVKAYQDEMRAAGIDWEFVQYSGAVHSFTNPDADRHGIVTPSAGLMNPNHYLAVAIRYLLTHRPDWPKDAAVGKIDPPERAQLRPAESLNLKGFQQPVQSYTLQAA